MSSTVSETSQVARIRAFMDAIAIKAKKKAVSEVFTARERKEFSLIVQEVLYLIAEDCETAQKGHRRDGNGIRFTTRTMRGSPGQPDELYLKMADVLLHVYREDNEEEEE